MTNLETILAKIQEAESEGDLYRAALTCSSAGQICLESKIYSEAAFYFQKSAEYYSGEEWEIQRAQALNQLGGSLILSSQAKQALEFLAEAKELLAGKEQPLLLAAVEGNLGLAYSELKDYRSAVVSHKFVLETAQEIQNSTLMLNALINLADSNLRDKNSRSAQGFALVALDLAKELDSRSSLIAIYDLLGMISSLQGDLKTSLDYHQLAYTSAVDQEDLLHQAIALANLALAHEGLTELELAHQLMSQAQDLFVLLSSEYKEKTSRDLARIHTGLNGVS